MSMWFQCSSDLSNCYNFVLYKLSCTVSLCTPRAQGYQPHLAYSWEYMTMFWRPWLQIARCDCVRASMARNISFRTVGNILSPKRCYQFRSIARQPRNQGRRRHLRVNEYPFKSRSRKSRERACYKCGSKRHSVFQCPKRSPIEKTFSLYDWIQYAKHGKTDHESIREGAWEPRNSKSLYG